MSALVHMCRMPSTAITQLRIWCVQMCSHQSAAAPATSQNSSGDVALMPSYEIPTITRITEQGMLCLLPYVIDVSSLTFTDQLHT